MMSTHVIYEYLWSGDQIQFYSTSLQKVTMYIYNYKKLPCTFTITKSDHVHSQAELSLPPFPPFCSESNKTWTVGTDHHCLTIPINLFSGSISQNKYFFWTSSEQGFSLSIVQFFPRLFNYVQGLLSSLSNLLSSLSNVA